MKAIRIYFDTSIYNIRQFTQLDKKEFQHTELAIYRLGWSTGRCSENALVICSYITPLMVSSKTHEALSRALPGKLDWINPQTVGCSSGSTQAIRAQW